MPGNASSSFAEAVLILISAWRCPEYEYFEIWSEVVIERLAHEAVAKRTTHRRIELNRMTLRLSADAADECNLLEVLQNKNL